MIRIKREEHYSFTAAGVRFTMAELTISIPIHTARIRAVMAPPTVAISFRTSAVLPSRTPVRNGNWKMISPCQMCSNASRAHPPKESFSSQPSFVAQLMVSGLPDSFATVRRAIPAATADLLIPFGETLPLHKAVFKKKCGESGAECFCIPDGGFMPSRNRFTILYLSLQEIQAFFRRFSDDFRFF